MPKQPYFMLSLLLFCTSDPAASVSSPLEWCLFVPYSQLLQAQVYIYEIEIYFPPEFGHSEVLGSFWALCSQWCQGPPIIGSDTGNEECGGGRAWSQHVLICLLIGDKLEFGNSFNHSCWSEFTLDVLFMWAVLPLSLKKKVNKPEWSHERGAELSVRARASVSFPNDL